MKKRHSIVLWLAVILTGLCGQMAALGLDASYDTAQIARFKVAGVPTSTIRSSGTCSLTNDTFDLIDRSYEYTGTYSLVNNGKKIAFVIDANGLSTVEEMLTSWTEALAADYGRTIDNISFDIRRTAITKAKISKTTNDPNNVTITVSGKLSAIIDGHPRTKGFTWKCKVTFSKVP